MLSLHVVCGLDGVGQIWAATILLSGIIQVCGHYTCIMNVIQYNSPALISVPLSGAVFHTYRLYLLGSPGTFGDPF